MLQVTGYRLQGCRRQHGQDMVTLLGQDMGNTSYCSRLRFLVNWESLKAGQIWPSWFCV
jgi:hypothetical protein